MEGTKTCSKCGECKPLSEFHQRKEARDGRRGECKDCVCSRVRAYVEKNKEIVKEKKAAFIAGKGREWHLAYQREQYEKNKQKYKDQSRNWQKENRQELGDSYVKKTLAMSIGVSRLQVQDQRLISIKREQLSLRRLAKELQSAANKAKEKP